MDRGNKDERGRCSDQRHAHIALGVPNVALSAEKVVGGGSAEQCGPPFDQFVKRANSQANRENKKRQPIRSRENIEPQQNFASDDRRNEALHEMAEPVIVVALPGEKRAEPIEQWHASVGVMTADAEHATVQGDERVAQCRETKSAIGGEQ